MLRQQRVQVSQGTVVSLGTDKSYCRAGVAGLAGWFNDELELPAVYPILDATTLSQRGVAVELAAEAFLEGGARILQFRHKELWTRDTYVVAHRVAALCAAAGATFVVNDRADYAALLGAGLHVGQEDLLPSDARRVMPAGALVGYSTHNAAQMVAAGEEPADYVAFGPIFGTVSKERPDPTTGPERLREIRGLTGRPLVAIGGITRDNAMTCWKAGADSVAVIADMLPLSCTKQTLRDRMTEWQQLTQK